MYDAIDCQSFAGGFTEGVRQAGMNVVAKRELPGGFGADSVLANFSGLDYEESPGEEWTPKTVPFVFGNPPCSGFSNMSNPNFRGIDSPVNSCMWELVGYAAKCDPDIVVFESVSAAYTQGAPLMRALHEHMEKLTGQKYGLWHLLHNGYNVGGPAIRRRYFFVLSRIGFGIEPAVPDRVPIVDEVIRDLEGLHNIREDQPLNGKTSWWLQEQGIQREDGLVDGHIVLENPLNRRLRDLIAGVEWNPRENFAVVVERYYKKYGKLPPSFGEDMERKIVDNDFHMGYTQPFRWDANRAGRVITGGAAMQFIHPHENRTLSLRECYRFQGFPDTWRIDPAIGDANGSYFYAWPGKGIPVQAGRWVAGWVKAALDGNPGPWVGKKLGEREWLIDANDDYRRVYHEKTGERGIFEPTGVYKKKLAERPEEMVE